MKRIQTYDLPGTYERSDGEAFHARYALDGDAIAYVAVCPVGSLYPSLAWADPQFHGFTEAETDKLYDKAAQFSHDDKALARAFGR